MPWRNARPMATAESCFVQSAAPYSTTLAGSCLFGLMGLDSDSMETSPFSNFHFEHRVPSVLTLGHASAAVQCNLGRSCGALELTRAFSRSRNYLERITRRILVFTVPAPELSVENLARRSVLDPQKPRYHSKKSLLV